MGEYAFRSGVTIVHHYDFHLVERHPGLLQKTGDGRTWFGLVQGALAQRLGRKVLAQGGVYPQFYLQATHSLKKGDSPLFYLL